MQTIITFLKLFIAFTLLGTSVYAVDIELDANITKVYPLDGNNTTCKTGDVYRLSNKTKYNGNQAFDLLLVVLESQNDGDKLIKNGTPLPCISVKDHNDTRLGVTVDFLLRRKNETDGPSSQNIAYMDLQIIPIKKSTPLNLPIDQLGADYLVHLDKLGITAFDLDTIDGSSTVGTDDLYIQSPGTVSLSNDTNVTKEDVVINGLDYKKLKGNIHGDCNDDTLPEMCRASGIIRIINTTQKLTFRLQNDNAHGTKRKNPFGNTWDYVNRLTSVSFKDGIILNQDHGDMPKSYGDAYHEIDDTLIMGSLKADDEETQYSSDASADDVNGADDEGAVSIEGASGDALNMTAGYAYTFNIETKGHGYLSAWVDSNKDGNFTEDEQIIMDYEVNSSEATIKHIENVQIPSNVTAGQSFIRVRLSENKGSKATGDGGVGEVEDYALTLLSSGGVVGIVYDDKNGNGIQDIGENGLENVRLTITAANGEKQNVTTDSNGQYHLNNVAVGNAQVEVIGGVPVGAKATTPNPASVTVLENVDSDKVEHGYQLQANLVTIKTVDKSTPQEGDSVIYTLSVTNNGPSQATNISLIDKLPSGLTYVSHLGDGTYSSATGKWEIASLANGAVATLNIEAKVNQGKSGQKITNVVTPAISPDSYDATSNGDDLNETIDVGAVPTMTISNASVTEGEKLVFTVSLSEESNFDTNITISTEDGTAEKPEDYSDANVTTLVIKAHSTSGQVSVQSNPDNKVERTENFIVKAVVNSGNMQNAEATGMGTIVDDDVLTQRLNIDNPSANEEIEQITYTVSISNPSSEDTTVALTLEDNTTSPQDHGAAPASVTIPAGTTSATVIIPVIKDEIVEQDETMILKGEITSNLGNGKQDEGIGTILDNGVMTKDDRIKSDRPHEAAGVNILENDENNTNPLTIDLSSNDDAPVGTTTNDTDGDGDIDEIIVPREGRWSVDNNGRVTFAPEDGFTGDPTFITYTVEDDKGNVSASTTIEADYPQTPTNANDDNATGETGTPTTLNVLENDTDNENDTNVSSVNLIVPKSVLVDINTTDTDGDGDTDKIIVPAEGVWSVDNNGRVTFTPEDGFTGDPTPIAYTVGDNTGEISESAMITVDIKQELRDDNVIGVLHKPRVIHILDNDDTVNPKTVSLKGPEDAIELDTDGDGDIDEITVTGEGVWSVDENGVLTFVPVAEFFRSPTPITYTAKDGNGNIVGPATVSIDYSSGALIEPRAFDDNLTVLFDRLYTRDASDNDFKGEGLQSQQIYHIIHPVTGKLVPSGEKVELDNGVVRMDEHGVYTYDPFANATGKDTFAYIMEDAVAQTSNAHVAITVDCASSQTSDGGDALETFSMLMMLCIMAMTGLLYIKKEEEV